MSKLINFFPFGFQPALIRTKNIRIRKGEKRGHLVGRQFNSIPTYVRDLAQERVSFERSGSTAIPDFSTWRKAVVIRMDCLYQSARQASALILKLCFFPIVSTNFQNLARSIGVFTLPLPIGQGQHCPLCRSVCRTTRKGYRQDLTF